MTKGQRLGFLAIAVAIALVAVVVLASGDDETGATSADAPTATPDASATRAPSEASPQETSTPTPTPEPPLLSAAKETALTFSEGETVRFRVRSATAEEVHVHGYDRYVKVPAGRTVNVAFEASITGIFEVELHRSGRLIAQLKVVP